MTQLLRALPTDRKSVLLLVLVGFALMLLDYVLIRQMTASFADLETSALLMTLAYFSGVSLGYFCSERVTPVLVRRLLAPFLLLQLALVVLGPLLAHALVARAGLTAAYVAVFLATTLFGASLYSIFLPNAVGDEGASIGRYYAAEVAGSIAGILCLFVIARAGMVAVQAAYLLCFVGITALVGARRRIVGLIAVTSVVFLLVSTRLDHAVSGTIHSAAHADGRPVRILSSRYTPYHKVEVIEAEGAGRMLVLDGRLQFEPSWHDDYSYFVAEYPARLLGKPSVCILGCGSMSTVGRIGKGAESIRIVDIDEGVFEASRDYFGAWNHLGELDHWSFQADDAKHFLATTPAAFDLILDDIPPAKTRQIALTYTREFFTLVRARLNPRGLFSLPTLISVTSKRSAYGRRILATLADVFDQVYVLTFGGSSYCFATGRGLSLDEETLRAAIDHPRRDEVRILLPDEVRRHVEGTAVITTNNMAELVDE